MNAYDDSIYEITFDSIKERYDEFDDIEKTLKNYYDKT